MDISSLTAILFIVMIILAPPSEPPRQDIMNKTENKINSQIIPDNSALVETATNDDEKESEYLALYSYIKKNYTQVSDEDAKEIAHYLVDLSKENKIDPKFVAAVMAKESSFNKKAVSPSGAKGLGQLKDFNLKPLDVQDPYNIKENSGGTMKYLKQMLDKWKGKTNQVGLALASYYKGYSNVKKDNETYEDPESKKYVGDILTQYDKIIDHKKNYQTKSQTETAIK